jgi:mono/diheme cytochrome c family protein
MSTEIKHIITASFLLILIFGVSQVIIKLPATKYSEATESVCGTCNDTAIPVLSETAQKGKILFQAHCASCHRLFGTGISLFGFERRGPWSDREKLYEFIRDPVALFKKDPYMRQWLKETGVMMPAFPDLTDTEIDCIVGYINESEKKILAPNKK